MIEDGELKRLDLVLDEASFTVENLGYTIQATPDPAGKNKNVLVINGTMYTLSQFHFHTLSEHTFVGRHAGMELHAVFQDSSSHYAVVAVLYRLGSKNSLLETLIQARLPEKTKSPATEVTVNLRDGLTSTASYYTYPGSLTIPPCSETVTWFVLKREAQFSPSQFEKFRRILGNDFRPTQDLHDRVVLATLK